MVVVSVRFSWKTSRYKNRKPVKILFIENKGTNDEEKEKFIHKRRKHKKKTENCDNMAFDPKRKCLWDFHKFSNFLYGITMITTFVFFKP